MENHTFDLYLASASPRRRELLDSVNIRYRIIIPAVDETQLSNEPAQNYVQRLAAAKAKMAQATVIADGLTDKPILAADTVVVKGEKSFGKPQNQQHAFAMWQQLSASEHQVMTAVSLCVDGRLSTQLNISTVEFIVLTQQQMQQYWASGEPRDKSGAYAIQGLASAWVQKISGSYSSVVGLPLYEVNNLLKQVNLNWL